MRRQRTRVPMKSLAVLALLSCGFVNPARADLFQGYTLGTFGAYTAGTNTTESNGTFSSPTSTFTSGTPASKNDAPNMLTMVGQSFNTNASTAFAIANLTYYNGQTDTGTAATNVAVTFTLEFTAPTTPNSIPNQEFQFAFNFDLTPNNYMPLSNPLNDDILTPQNVYSATTFTVNSQTYTLHLLGFSTDGGNNDRVAVHAPRIDSGYFHTLRGTHHPTQRRTRTFLPDDGHARRAFAPRRAPLAASTPAM